MAIELATKYGKYVDEVMKEASKMALIAGARFDFTGANVVKIYKIGTAPMNNYGRSGREEGNWSRYGEVSTLDATTEEMSLTKDRSFTFEIDKLDKDETNGNLNAAEALNRQVREVVIPEVDTYVYQKVVDNAGVIVNEVLTKDNIYDAITAGSVALDEEDVPATGRYILVTPETLKLIKMNEYLTLNEDIGKELRVQGVIATLDGANVIKVPSYRLPEKFGFLYGHPCAVAAPVKLKDYKIHQDPPGLSGDLVEGRINYDAFVLENKIAALYCHMNKAEA